MILPTQAYLAAVIALAVSSAAGGWYVTKTHYQAKISAIELKQEQQKTELLEQERESLIIYAGKITEAQQNHDKNISTIVTLRSDVKRLREQMRFPPIFTTAASADSNSADGMVSGRVQEGFNRLSERTEQLLERAEQLNAAAIRSNESQ